MSSNQTRPARRLAPAAGTYPTGAGGIARGWDGHAWAADTLADPGAAENPLHPATGRAAWDFRPRRWTWVAMGGLAVGAVLAVIAASSAPPSKALLGLAGLVSVGAMLTAAVMAVANRLRLGQLHAWTPIVGWGVASGVVAAGLAGLLEAVFVGDAAHPRFGVVGAAVAAGIIEEGGKLALPVALWLYIARWREPRTGFAIALISGATFGLIEGTAYVATVTPVRGHGLAEKAQIADVLETLGQRWFYELLHPWLPASVAAVACLAAWRGRRLLGRATLAAFALAVVAHLVNDGGASLIQPVASPAVPLFVLVVLIATFVLLYRRNAKELAPPDALATNPTHWRPKIPTPHQT